MKPINFAQANQLLSAPEGWDKTQEECSDLHVLNTGETLISCWKPSDIELEALNGGGVVLLMIHGKTHPPVRISSAVMDEPTRDVDDPLHKDAKDSFNKARTSHGKSVN